MSRPAKTRSASKSAVRRNTAKPPIGARAERQKARQELALDIAGRVFRKQGMAQTTMADIAAAMGVTKMVLYRRYASKELLIEALFKRVVDAIKSTDIGPWGGYGSRLRATLSAIREIEDGYVALVRDGDLYSPSRPYGQLLRKHSKNMYKRLLHFPEPGESADPLAARLCLELIVTFSHQSLMWWVQHGTPDRDDEFLTWIAFMIRSWREGSLEIFGLGDPNFVPPASPYDLLPD